MKTNFLITLSALAAASIASPLENAVAADASAQEVSAKISASDYGILTFALTLEHLETAFYASALKKFKKSDFQDETLYNNMLRVYRDEAAHVDAISSVFKAGKKAVPGPCQYNFPFNSTTDFLKLASVIEGVGVSAYAGAAPAISSKDVLKSAASILPIEARHAAVLRLAVGEAPYPSAFDVPLSVMQVWTLASQFIVKGSCPKAVTSLGLKTFPSLSLIQTATQTTVAANSTITLEADIPALKSPKARSVQHRRHEALHRKREEQQADRARTIYVAFLTADGAITVEAQLGNGVITAQVPDGVYGQVYVVLTTSKTGVSDKTILAGPAIVEIADNVSAGAISDPNYVGDIIPTPANNTNTSGGASVSAGVSGGVKLDTDAVTEEVESC